MGVYDSITFKRQDEYQVEKDFKAQQINYDAGDLSVKISYILSQYAPLMGEFILSDETKMDLLAEAKQGLHVVLTSDEHRASPIEEKIITLAVVELTKECDEQAQKDSEDRSTQLWGHILSKLGYGENDQTIRKYLCDIIHRNVRFFAPEGQKYYNTLNIQALSPSWSVKHLLNILFSFYKDNLEYQYDPDVGIMQRFVKNIQKRWSDESGKNDRDEKLRSDILSSSFKMLFQYRPAYMSAICDALLFRIDALLRGKNILDSEHNRWDQLLEDWFNEKTAEEKQTMRESRKRADNERVANSVQHIRPQYSLEGGCICIQLPKIRLPEITERPIVELRQNEVKIAEERPKVFGDDLCLTTRAVQFYLSNYEVQWDKPFLFEVILRCDGKIVYSSGKQLYREYLLFDANGHETEYRATTSRMNIVASSKTQIKIVSEDDYYAMGANGQAYEFSTDSVVIVNGKDIFDTSFTKQGIYCYMNEPEFTDLYVKHGENRATAYKEIPTLSISLQSSAKIHQYQIVEDGNAAVSMGEFECAKDGTVRITLDRSPYYVHTIKVKEFATGKVIYERDYCLLPELSYSFDQPYYFNISGGGTLKYCIGANLHEQKFVLAVNQKEIEVELEEYPIACYISVPKIVVRIKGENGFLLPKNIWWEDIEQDVFLAVTAPKEVRVTPVIDAHELPQMKNRNLYELGNFIHSRKWTEKIQTLGLLIWFDHKNVPQELTNIYFQETFLDTPITFSEKKVIWNPNKVFMGNRRAEFKILLENDEQDEPWMYKEKYRISALEKKFPCGVGCYAYQVFLCVPKRLLSNATEKLLYEGKIEVTVSPEVRYQNSELWLTRVSYWSAATEQMESSPIVPAGGVIMDIVYEGESESPNSSSGEKSAEYSGILKFQMPNGHFQDFNREENERFESINPVRFWIERIEDRYSLVLRTNDGEPLLIDARFTHINPEIRIVNKKIAIRNDLEKKKICLAETFEFEEKRGHYHESI